MKKILFLISIISLTLITSCTSNSSNEIVEIDQSSLKGTWTMTSYIGITTTKYTYEDTSGSITSEYIGKDFDSSLEITDTQMITSGTYNLDITTSSDSHSFSNTSYVLTDNSSNYILEGNTIESDLDFSYSDVGFSEFEASVKVETLTDTKLVLKQSFNGEIEESGASNIINSLVTVEYAR